jgi:dTDP-glucose 4,6-dehydratase
MNLLITGGCGFIGSNFINSYFYHNACQRLVNIDALYYCADENNVKKDIQQHPRYVMVKGNICSSDMVSFVLEHYQITHVIHFAAQSHVQNSFEDSILFTRDNILGTHTLLECCRKYGKIQKFIHVSTDEVYGESMIIDDTQKTEESALCPTNPYAATKASAELLAKSYCHSFKMPIIITRGNNVYGENQYPEKLIPKFITHLLQHHKLPIQGDGSHTRAFLHVSDVVNAFITILEHGKEGEIYNIGCDEQMEYTVDDIAKLLVMLIYNEDNYQSYIEYVEDRPYNDKRYYISNSKLKEMGWTIQKDFLEGLTELINYFRQKIKN